LGQIQPVFLERNLKRMKNIRDANQFEVENGLKIWQLPPTNKIVYTEGTCDVIYYKRKTQLSIDDEFTIDLKAALEMDSSILKRRRLI